MAFTLSRWTCQELAACDGDQAEFYCQDCETYQCAPCEGMLHASQFISHKRQALCLGEEDSACPESLEATCTLFCNAKNKASVYCSQCGIVLCADCDTIVHQSTRSDHTRSDIPPDLIRGSSFLLVDEEEQIVVEDVDLLAHHLGCQRNSRMKVVSIFGNTGDGKSHTLNHVFFHGQEVFRTSAHQRSCTVGIWAAYSPLRKALIIDTEGLLGTSNNENQRTRLLLKVLAVSDIVVYRTRAERLHNDMFTFLADASNAYWKHFSPELKSALERNKLELPLSSLGPCVVVFQETHHTQLLGDRSGCHNLPQESEGDKNLVPTLDQDLCDLSAEELLQKRFTDLKQMPKAFSSIEYVGTRTQFPPTDFSGLKRCLSDLLLNNSVRTPRPLEVILLALKSLNERFSGEIDPHRPSIFPDAYFRCCERCISCSVQCEESVNHKTPHAAPSSRCKYQHHLDNKVYLCKICCDQGIVRVVEPKAWSESESGLLGLVKYTWTGYVIECDSCGVIYRSRQHWYGNPPPEHGAVRSENKHVWPQAMRCNGDAFTPTHKGRRMLDTMSSAAETMSGLTSSSSRAIGSWTTDQIAPSYWVPNSLIQECNACSKEFGPTETKHHCRACGQGFCDKCSSHSMPVPKRGWGKTPVRVCDACYSQQSMDPSAWCNQEMQTSSTARYASEALYSIVGVVGDAMKYPRQAIVESVRPSYWEPDESIVDCSVCRTHFRSSENRHHCRACGRGVCGKCSEKTLPVPSRGWDYPVRVCDSCVQRKRTF